MLVFRTGIHKMLVRIANLKDHEKLSLKKQSDPGLRCFTMPSKQATSVQNFRTFNVKYKLACAYSEDSNQSAHSYSLVDALVFRQKKR